MSRASTMRMPPSCSTDPVAVGAEMVVIGEDAAAGYALFFDCYSSFQGTGIFLEDLFVRNEFRGKGVGQALLSRIAARIVEFAYFGIMFNVLDWNQSALQFFESPGAAL